MLKHPYRFACAVALIAALGLSPSVCRAGLFDCLTPDPAPSTYAPPFQAQRVAYMPAANPCDPCAAPAVSYVPETKYRWTFSRIDRTEYEPVAACDPCTGCPTTAYRPVVKKSLLPWLHREAYTTYRAVPVAQATSVSYRPTVCDPCANVCDPCAGVSTGMAAPALGSSACATCVPSTTRYSNGGSSDPGYSGQTFEDGGTDWGPVDSEEEERYKPTPDDETDKATETDGQPTSMPRMTIPPVPGDRTASTGRVRTVSYDAPTSLNVSGNLYQAATVSVPLRLVPVE